LISVMLRYLTGFIIGSFLGGAIGFISKCTTGTCPLTSNISVTILVGGMIGIMLAARPLEEKPKDKEQKIEDKKENNME